jgi:hypothetical protein
MNPTGCLYFLERFVGEFLKREAVPRHDGINRLPRFLIKLDTLTDTRKCQLAMSLRPKSSVTTTNKEEAPAEGQGSELSHGGRWLVRD